MLPKVPARWVLILPLLYSLEAEAQVKVGSPGAQALELPKSGSLLPQRNRSWVDTHMRCSSWLAGVGSGWNRPYLRRGLAGTEAIQYPLGPVDGIATGDVGQGIQGCTELWEKRADVRPGLGRRKAVELAGVTGEEGA